MHKGFSLATAAPWLPIALPLGAFHFTLSTDACAPVECVTPRGEPFRLIRLHASF
jgi:hypothetical protein